MKHLTKREEEIMDLFWIKGSLFVKEIVDQLAGPRPHYNTISTIVRLLEEKGFIGHEQFGNTYRYHALISREEHSRNTMKEVVRKYFNKSYSSVISMFVQEEVISPEEIQELIRQAKSTKSKENE